MRSTELFKRRSETLKAVGPTLVVMPAGAPSIRAVTAALEAIGLRPDVYHNARSALATLERNRPVLVVHSAQLPDMDGAAFHTAVQRRSGGQRIPTLAIMPADRTPDQHFGTQTGIMEYICTPFRADDLSSRLQGLLPGAGVRVGGETARPAKARAAKSSGAPVSATTASVRSPGPTPSAAAPAEAGRAGAETVRAEAGTVRAEAETVRTETAARRPEPVRSTAEARTERSEPRPAEPRKTESRIEEPVPTTQDLVEGADLSIQVVGLGEWGRRAAERFAARGFGARAVETGESVRRSKLPRSRRYRSAISRVAADNYAAAERALASDAILGEALATDANADLFIVVANLAVGAGSLMAALLHRIAEAVPSAKRLAVARLPGSRSGPDERALGLYALNAVLQAPPTSVVLVQAAGGIGVSADEEANVSLARLVDLFDVAAGRAGEPLLGIGRSALIQHLATPGFIGWREAALDEESCREGAPGWHEGLAADSVGWQPEGFAWAEAQAVLPFVRAPRAWLDGGGRAHFDRLVRAAWDESAPCAIAPALYAGEPPLVVLVSAGVPYPRGVLTLRDSVTADRARIAEKRRAAGTLIPLSDDFAPAESGIMAEGPPTIEPVVPEEMATVLRAELRAEPMAEREEAAPEAEITLEPEPAPKAERVREPEPLAMDALLAAPTASTEAAEATAPEALAGAEALEAGIATVTSPEPLVEAPPETPATSEVPAPLEASSIETPAAESTAETDRAGGGAPPFQTIEGAGPGEPAESFASEAAGDSTPVAAPAARVETADESRPSTILAEPSIVTGPAPPTVRPEAERPEPSAPTFRAPVPAAYQRALALVRRILRPGTTGGEIDLGGIRYALYDLLEVVREDPEAILPEAFRAVKEEYFERHHVNVALFALMTGDVLRESLGEVIDLGTAAMLHDIGMSETREMWDVDVRLSPTLFDRAVRHHPENGYRRLQEISGMTGDIARMVLEEHERMDGTGYPAGLPGDQIDPGARILAACDTLEALTHPRPFREHLSPAEALSRLQILAQYTLDPSVVEATTDALGPFLPHLDVRHDRG